MFALNVTLLGLILATDFLRGGVKKISLKRRKEHVVMYTNKNSASATHHIAFVWGYCLENSWTILVLCTSARLPSRWFLYCLLLKSFLPIIFSNQWIYDLPLHQKLLPVACALVCSSRNMRHGYFLSWIFRSNRCVRFVQCGFWRTIWFSKRAATHTNT